jgi:hypothetical protein
MTFILGMALGSLLTIGTAFIFAADSHLDEGDENYYNK